MRRFAWLTLAIGLTACADEQPLAPRSGADFAPLPVLTSVAASSVTLASLGTPLGWTDSFAEGVNSSGLGVGWASGGSPSFVAVVFDTPVQVIPSDFPPPALAIQAYSINDAQVATGTEAFVYSVGSAAATRLPTLAGDYTGFAEVGYDINNAGDVVGFSRLASSPQFPRAVLWRGASGYTPIDLGVPAGAPALLPSEARSIAPNLSGANTIVVGYTEQCATVTLGCTDSWGPRHAFIWRNGIMRLLPSVPGPGADHDWSEAYGVADNGMVVGMSLDKGAILWDGGQVIELGLPCGALFSGGYGASVARAIALTSSTPSRVLIVGDCGGQPTVWFDNGPCGYQAELLPLLAGDTDGAARDVNASGQIVGYTRASAAGGPGHAVLWGFTPPPLSSTCPSLELSKQTAQANVLAGTRIVFTLDVRNTGPGTAEGVVLSDALPTGPGLSWVIDMQAPGTPCAISAGTLTCKIGDLASDASFSVSVGTETGTSSCGTYDNTASATAANRSRAEASASVTVECVQENFSGCTPGFWKQPKHFEYWTPPYTPATQISGVFTGVAGYYTARDNEPIADQTLLQGLSFQGGSSLGGAAEILLRAGIAAVLNAASPNVNYTRATSDVIATVNSALASGDRTAILGLASGLDADNNRQCTAK